LLASTTGGLDQSTTHGNRTPTSYICHGCLISSRGVIFPGSHRVEGTEVVRVVIVKGDYCSVFPQAFIQNYARTA
jgi:hypothetical protein